MCQHYWLSSGLDSTTTEGRSMGYDKQGNPRFSPVFNIDNFFILPLVQSWDAFSSLLFSSHPLKHCIPPSFLPLWPSSCLTLVFKGSVPLASLAAHLSEVRSTAELELQYQRAISHFVYIFAFCGETEKTSDIKTAKENISFISLAMFKRKTPRRRSWLKKRHTHEKVFIPDITQSSTYCHLLSKTTPISLDYI